MSHYMTSDDIIASVKRRCNIPTNVSSDQNADFLSFADEEIAIGLVPSVIQLHEDYFSFAQEEDLEDDVVRYKIPYRAVGNRIKDVYYKDENDNIFEMTRIDKSELPHYQNGNFLSANKMFYVENNEVVLVPSSLPDASGSLVFTYYMRPNSLVLLEKVAVITAINTSTGVVSVNDIPDDFSGTSLFDFVQVKSPHKTLDFDVSASSIDTGNNEITFDPADLPTGLEVGDHVCLATEAAIPQVPSDLHVIVAHRVACRILEAQGDMEGLQMANVKLAEMDKKLQTVIHDRVESSAKKITNHNSFLRSSSRHRNRGW